MMSESLTRYPLCWPVGWRRSTSKRPSAFGTRSSGNGSKRSLSISDGCGRVLAALGAMGIAQSTILISTNVKASRSDGLPRSDQAEPQDRGVAVYWLTPKGKQQCMAIDRYLRVADNLAAIAATLEAMRAIERHGGADILDRAFTGFTALPAPEQPWQVLGLDSHASPEQVQEAYRRLAMEHHPDRGGDPAQMARINAARDDLLRGNNSGG